jgi:hypothetical protein
MKKSFFFGEGPPLYGEKRVKKFFSSIYDNSCRNRKPLSSYLAQKMQKTS